MFSCRLQSLCWSVSPVVLQAVTDPAPSTWLLLPSSCSATPANCGSAKCKAVGGCLVCHKSWVHTARQSEQESSDLSVNTLMLASTCKLRMMHPHNGCVSCIALQRTRHTALPCSETILWKTPCQAHKSVAQCAMEVLKPAVSPAFARHALCHVHKPAQRSCVRTHLQALPPAAETHLGLQPPSPQLPQGQDAHHGLPLTALLQDPVWDLRGLPLRRGR